MRTFRRWLTGLVLALALAGAVGLGNPQTTFAGGGELVTPNYYNTGGDGGKSVVCQCGWR
jgi:hypothetical protein